MMRSLPLLLAALFTLAPSAVPAADARWQALADHPLRPLSGGAAARAAVQGEPVLLHFWASWCAPCRDELPRLDALVTRWRERGLQPVVVSVDRDSTRARRFAADLELATPLYLDGPEGLARELDLPALPTSYLFDGQGRLVCELRGADEAGLRDLERKLSALLTPDPAAAGLGGLQ